MALVPNISQIYGPEDTLIKFATFRPDAPGCSRLLGLEATKEITPDGKKLLNAAARKLLQ